MRAVPVMTLCGMLAGVACGSSGGGGGGGGPDGGGGGEGTAQGFVNDYCTAVAQCCAASGVSSSSVAAQCKSSLGGVYLSSTTYTESYEGLGFGTVYDSAAGQACIRALQEASSQAPGCLAADTFNPACANVFSCSSLRGTKSAGETCACDAECVAPSGGKATCYGSHVGSDGGVQSTGTCVQLAAGKAGQGPCLMTVDRSGTSTNRWTGTGPLPVQATFCNTSDGDWCDAATQLCTSLVGTGQPCGQDWDCIAADWCPFSAAGGRNTCAARIADGASCAGASSACLLSSYCEPSSRICQPLKADGSPCKYGIECQGGLCKTQSGSSGTCSTKNPGSDLCLL